MKSTKQIIMKSDGDVVPNYKNSNTNLVSFTIPKSLTEQDLKSLSLVIRYIRKC